METKKSNNADLENKRWIGFALGLIIALSIFFVAMEYSAQDGEEKEVNTNLLKDLKLHDQEMLPAIDQQNLTKEKDDKAPTVEDMLNIKRSETPQKVTPHEVGNTESDDDKTAAPNINETPTLTQQATSLPDPTKVEEVAKKETNKFTEDNSDKKIERSDDKIKKRILSETPTPPGGWSSFMVWLTK
ncbi:energy transducer TonB, partial [Prevotella nigrescens]